MKTENLTKAAQTADLLYQDLAAAHRGAKGAPETMLPNDQLAPSPTPC
jgi:hypothetical protein